MGEALRLGECELLGQAVGVLVGEGGAVALTDRLLQPTEDTLWLGICGSLGPPAMVCECEALTVREAVPLPEALPQPEDVALRLGVVEPLAQPEALSDGAELRDCDAESLLLKVELPLLAGDALRPGDWEADKEPARLPDGVALCTADAEELGEALPQPEAEA